MTKGLHTLTRCLSAGLLVCGMAFGLNAQAQQSDFRPYKGIGWGMFYDKTAQTLLNYLVPVAYDRPTHDKIILSDFLGCGKDLTIVLVRPYVDPDYYDIELQMPGGQYDDKGFFYPPFEHEPFGYAIEAPYGELFGPVYQPTSYFHEPFEYIGLYYFNYTHYDYCYFDVKTQEDYYDNVPRVYYDPDDENPANGIDQIDLSLEHTYYNLEGRRVKADAKGLIIENGRKIWR